MTFDFQFDATADQTVTFEECTTPVQFLFEPSSGSVEYATRNGRTWLTPERRQMVAELVDDAEFDGTEALRVRREGTRFALFPMMGALGWRVLVTVSNEETPPRTAASEKLTERQLEVAKCAAAGDTGPEIAEQLGVEPSTVYDHLRKIYDRLDISSRAELTRAVLDDGTELPRE